MREAAPSHADGKVVLPRGCPVQHRRSAPPAGPCRRGLWHLLLSSIAAASGFDLLAVSIPAHPNFVIFPFACSRFCSPAGFCGRPAADGRFS
uniref:Uncharacterized protein n=1 Tax=Arundo donax TaxID=35708 RepID=A0A0A9AII2_ARUDO